MKYFYQMDLGKFNNKTNGIAHRRWLLQVNPKLASLITEVIGPNWIIFPRLVAVNFKNEYKRLRDRTDKLLDHIIYHKFFSSKRLMKHK
ncbi:Glycogen phosphorylase [Caldibacillus thermoamylovorans]|nr:Glycogen phosphorylase [Caldibacillus thermoamylovorans]